jgi:hypothetical protein
MKWIGYAGLSLVLTVGLAGQALSQQPQARSTAEYNAYLAFYQEQNPATKAELGEKFLVDYKDSDFKPGSYLLLAQAYEGSQNWAKVMEIAGRYEQEVPNAEAQNKAFMFEKGMMAAQQANNFPKVVEFGDKMLGIDPNNLNAQLTLSSMIPERLPQSEAEKQAALTKAQALGQKAHDQVEAMFKGPKRPELTQEQWDQQRKILEGQVHATLGLVHLHRMEYDDSVFMYEYVVELNPRDGLGQYRLGLGYTGQTTAASQALAGFVKAENDAKSARAPQEEIDSLVATREAAQQDALQKREKAIDSLAKAVAIGGEVAAPARQQLERLYRAKNNDSIDGLDALIAQKKSDLGV